MFHHGNQQADQDSDPAQLSLLAVLRGQRNRLTFKSTLRHCTRQLRVIGLKRLEVGI